MSVSICIGEYSTTSYRVPGIGIMVHSLEELCYVIMENAFLLDDSFMGKELVDFVGNKIGEKDFARELGKRLMDKVSLAAFCRCILEYVGLYSAAQMQDTLGILSKSEGLTGVEKQKKQVDFLVEKRKYKAALRGYDELLEHLEKNDAKNLAPQTKADILHNKGVALCGLMLYDRAATAFWDAFVLMGDREECIAYLAAKRMELSDDEYIRLVADLPEFMEESIEVEGRMQTLGIEFEASETRDLLNRRMAARNSDPGNYYRESDTLPAYLKNTYRSYVTE